MRQRERLIARVRQMRLTAAEGEPRPAAPAGTSMPASVHELELRIAHLEEELRGFQDSVHRENVRQTRRLVDLEARTEPAAIAIALSADARQRGL